MNLSLFARMRELEKLGGDLTLEVDPSRHYFPGEGRWKFKGKDLEFLVDYVGASPDGSKEGWKTPHDVAWCPGEKTVVAAAPTATERFEPLDAKPKFRRD